MPYDYEEILNIKVHVYLSKKMFYNLFGDLSWGDFWDLSLGRNLRAKDCTEDTALYFELVKGIKCKTLDSLCELSKI